MKNIFDFFCILIQLPEKIKKGVFEPFLFLCLSYIIKGSKLLMKDLFLRNKFTNLLILKKELLRKY